MPKSKIHIISFNVPYPANYGGIIDVYYKLTSLHAQGLKVILHCFDYGRGEQEQLNKLCEKVYYYKRYTGLLSQFSKLPYIVKSRSNKQLLINLCKDNAPIFFEGLHTTYYIKHPDLENRVKIVRTHNIEHDYYSLLAREERNWYKKWFFYFESARLKKYQNVLLASNLIASISRNDKTYFEQQYNNVFWLPPFHPNTEIDVELDELGNFALYHGNLSVRENIQAALFVIETLKNSNVKIIIAGKNPSKEIYAAANQHSHILIESNLSKERMNELLQKAQVHLLPTFQPTGIKLKLMAALFRGKHCIANNEMIEGTGLEKLCHIANSPQQFAEKVNQLMGIPFTEQDLIVRKEVLTKHFDNQRNATLLIDKVFGR